MLLVGTSDTMRGKRGETTPLSGIMTFSIKVQDSRREAVTSDCGLQRLLSLSRETQAPLDMFGVVVSYTNGG